MSSWQWLYDNVIFSNQQSPLLVLTDTGNHHITLIASNTHNCFDTLTKVVRTHPLPLVDFSYSPPTLIYPQTMVQLIPANSTNATFSWNSSSGISSSLPAPVVSFADTGTYTIHLFYADSNGCKGKQQHEIRVLRRYTDMAVLNLFAELQYDSYCKVDAFLANLGSTVVNTFDISLQLTNSGSLKETWTGVLNPGVVIPYHFTAEPFMENTDRIICAEIGKVNLSSDEISANNNYCTVTESGILNVLQPYPNPVSAMLNIPVISDKEQNVNMEIKNILGQSILNPDPIMVAKGLNIMTIDVSALQKACYYLNLSIGTKTFMFKLLKQ